jgi:pimeloyl-ACP methyl ester carboxylesterase
MTAYRSLRRRSAAFTATLATVLAATLTGTAAPAAAAAAPVAWSPCTETTLVGYDCATYLVPLDHDKPGGATTPIALSRRPANNPATRIGTIFVNPGGPGGAGRGLVRSSATIFSTAVLDRFDVVGFDPRGIGASAPLQCFTDDVAAEALFNKMSLVPLTKQQIVDTLRANYAYTEACKRDAGPLLTHMSTLNVAKDLDLLRQGVGDRDLTFLGFSYGTLIGATYANLFPQRVRAIINDGNVDPDQRTNHRLANKFDRAGGFEKALDGMLKACDAAGAACAFSGGARAKFDALRERLRQGPFDTGDGEQITIDDLTNYITGQLYVITRFPATAATLQATYELVISPGPAARRGIAANPLPAAPKGRGWLGDAYSYNANDSFFAVNCADAPLPRVPALYPGFAVVFESAHRTFGRAEAFGEVGCANWPKITERYNGPWNRRTANPVLVVNPTYDPATPYVFAQRMTRELGNARLLTLDGFGHTTRFSACITGWYTRYLLERELPPVGTRCAQDVAPFPPA